MRTSLFFFGFCIISFICFGQNEISFTASLIPQVFGTNIISNGFDNRDMAISPANDELFYTLQYRGIFSAILCSHKVNGHWEAPEIANFSGQFNDLEPAFSPDGKKLYFTSNRPLSDTSLQEKDYDIWYIEKSKSGWGPPKNLGAPVNTHKDEFYASVAKNGNLYFTRDNDSTRDDIFLAQFNNGKYEQPQALGKEINSSGLDFNAYIDPNEKYLLFSSYKRDDDLGGGDLYISVYRNGKWTTAVNMGPKLNSTTLDYSPFVSFDHKDLFFTSRRSTLKFPFTKKKNLIEINELLDSYGNGSEDIYIVDAKVLDEYLK